MAPEAILAQVFGVPRFSITDETSNATVGAWDSLNHVTLVLELESIYGISLSAEEALTMTDVATIKHVLRSHGVDLDEE